MTRQWIASLLIATLVVGGGPAGVRANTSAQEPTGGQAGHWTMANLARARYMPAVATVGTKVLFAGGCTGNCEHPRIFGTSAAVDIYDSATGEWSTASLAEPRRSTGMAVATVGAQVLFAGGIAGQRPPASGVVDIYDDAMGQWSSTRLAQTRAHIAAATVGTKVLFAGGGTAASSDSQYIEPSAAVDIYDSATGQWSTATLSVAQARTPLVATVGSRVLFANGTTGGDASALVDIYDDATGQWTTACLSQARQEMRVATVGSRVLFAGGRTSAAFDAPASAVVDIYDNATGQWSTASLKQPRYNLEVVTVGDQVLFARGWSGRSESTVVDIYDSKTGQWSVGSVSAEDYRTPVSVGTRALFAGGARGDSYSAAVDVYDQGTGQWTTAALSEARVVSRVARLGSQVLFAGGTLGRQNALSDVVDIYDSASGNWSASALPTVRSNLVVATVGGQALFAGGTERYAPSTLVDIYWRTTAARID